MTSNMNPLKGMGTSTARLRYVGGVLFHTVLFGKRILINNAFTAVLKFSDIGALLLQVYYILTHCSWTLSILWLLSKNKD
jgi:hypothetical protein